LHALRIPDETPAAEREQLKQALATKADEAAAHAAELRATCAKRAREVHVFAEAVRGCLTEDAFPERIPVLPPPAPRKGGDPPGAAELRAALLKNPRGVENLARLAELYLGSGDVGTALLVLDRANDV